MSDICMKCQELTCECVKFYRIVDSNIAERAPIIQTLYEVKRTAQGSWIVHSWVYPLPCDPPLNRRTLRGYGARWVAEGTRRAYAYRTQVLALESYKIRKRRQIQHAHNSIANAENGLAWANHVELQDEYFTFVAAPAPAPLVKGIPWA